jgi:hypothetical protein
MNSSSETIIEPIVGGRQANKTGDVLELFVQRLLQDNGYTEFWNHKEQVFANRHSVGGKQYAKEVIIGDSIYDTKVRCDFLILNKEKFPDGLAVECKWQQSSGSVDVKYPYNVFNILKIGVPTIIIIDGKGARKKAVDWLRSQAHPTKALIGVYDMSEFQALVNKGFLA